MSGYVAIGLIMLIIAVGLFSAFLILRRRQLLSKWDVLLYMSLLGMVGLIFLLITTFWGHNYFAEIDSGVGTGIGFFGGATVISVFVAIAPTKEQKLFRIISCAAFFILALCFLGSCFYMGRLMLDNEIVISSALL